MTSYEEIVRRIRGKLQNSEDEYLVHFEKMEDLTEDPEKRAIYSIEYGKVAYWQGCIDAYRAVIQIIREELRK